MLIQLSIVILIALVWFDLKWEKNNSREDFFKANPTSSSSLYPSAFDDDASSPLPVLINSDKVSLIWGNRVRNCILSIQNVLGLSPQGSLSNVSERINKVVSSDGRMNVPVVEEMYGISPLSDSLYPRNDQHSGTLFIGQSNDGSNDELYILQRKNGVYQYHPIMNGLFANANNYRLLPSGLFYFNNSPTRYARYANDQLEVSSLVRLMNGVSLNANLTTISGSIGSPTLINVVSGSGDNKIIRNIIQVTSFTGSDTYFRLLVGSANGIPDGTFLLLHRSSSGGNCILQAHPTIVLRSASWIGNNNGILFLYHNAGVWFEICRS